MLRESKYIQRIIGGKTSEITVDNTKVLVINEATYSKNSSYKESGTIKNSWYLIKPLY